MTVARAADETPKRCRVHAVDDRWATLGRSVLHLPFGAPFDPFRGFPPRQFADDLITPSPTFCGGSSDRCLTARRTALPTTARRCEYGRPVGSGRRHGLITDAPKPEGGPPCSVNPAQ